MKTHSFLFSALLLSISLLGAALPAYATGNNCSFNVTGLSLSFGALNPGSGSPVSMAVSGASMVGDCAPGQKTMTISGDDGLYYNNGSRNLKNADNGDLIPYSLTGLPQSSSGPGNGNYVPFTFNGSILWSAYANASAGSYSDTVIISVTP